VGLDTNGTRLVLYAKSLGASFNNFATIGRQEMHLPATSLKRLLRLFGISVEYDEAKALLTQEQGYCEPFLRRLGAKKYVHLMPVNMNTRLFFSISTTLFQRNSRTDSMLF
jgi:hypothetical protein